MTYTENSYKEIQVKRHVHFNFSEKNKISSNKKILVECKTTNVDYLPREHPDLLVLRGCSQADRQGAVSQDLGGRAAPKLTHMALGRRLPLLLTWASPQANFLKDNI